MQPDQQLVADVNTDEVVRKTHTVGRGEDLGSIAKAYGVSATDIKHWNNLRRGKVREGDQLVIELRQRNAVAAVNTRANRPNTSADVTIPSKTSSNTADSRAISSKSYNQTQRAVPQRNSEKYRNNGYASASKKSSARKSSRRKSRTSKPVVVTVKSGENLEKIAKRNGTTVDAIRKANGMKKNETMLHPGDKLKIPKAAKATSSKTKSKSTSKTSKKKKRR